MNLVLSLLAADCGTAEQCLAAARAGFEELATTADAHQEACDQGDADACLTVTQIAWSGALPELPAQAGDASLAQACGAGLKPACALDAARRVRVPIAAEDPIQLPDLASATEQAAALGLPLRCIAELEVDPATPYQQVSDAQVALEGLGCGVRVADRSIEVAEKVPIILGALDKDLINEEVHSEMNRIRFCYQRQLAKDPTLSGKVVVKFVIAADGSVQSATIKSTTMKNEKVESCIAGVFFNQMQFPEPKGGGIVIVSYPFVFEPG